MANTNPVLKHDPVNYGEEHSVKRDGDEITVTHTYTVSLALFPFSFAATGLVVALTYAKRKVASTLMNVIGRERYAMVLMALSSAGVKWHTLAYY